MNQKFIIDVSAHQKDIDWEKVKGQIDGAILRCGYGSNYTKQDDKKWKRNADECTRLGIPFGVYIYSYAKTVEAAKSEAEHVLRLVEGYKLSLPIYYDLEEKGTEKGAIERALVFGDIIENAGYWCGIYANEYWWKSIINGPELNRFTKWVAKYNKNNGKPGALPTIKGCDIWQYTSKGQLDGIKGNVDFNLMSRDLIAEVTGLIRIEGKSVLEVAKEVIDGHWGNGIDRMNRLNAAGYRYDEVQAQVNALLSK